MTCKNPVTRGSASVKKQTDCFAVLQGVELIPYRPLKGLRERLRACFHGGGGTRLSIQSLIIN